MGLWVEERFADYKAPSFHLASPKSFNVVADALVNSLTSEVSTLMPWQTEAGELLRRPLVEQDEEAPVPSVRMMPLAA